MGTPLKLTYKGKTRTIREWAEEVGISRTILYSRIASKWSIEEALTTPVRRFRLAHRSNNLRNLYEYIVTYKEENDGASPGYRSIGDKFDISLSQAKGWISDLEEKGLIVTTSKARSIQVVGGKWTAPSLNLEEVFNGNS